MKLRTAMELGRVSNLPTLWSNCLAGALLAGMPLSLPMLAWLMLALSVMYLGGMFLNDAFDADWDAQFKAQRPIPSGRASAGEVWRAGWVLLACGPLLILTVVPSSGGTGYSSALASSILLAVSIVAYDRVHKTAGYAPWIMGCCRLLVYTTAGLAMGAMNPLLAAGGLSMMAYIVGLTYVARSEHLNNPGSWWPLLLLGAPVMLAASLLAQHRETAVFLAILLLWLGLRLRDLWPGPRRNVPAGVGGLLAGIPLVDATVLAGIGHWFAACLALAAFSATLILQRFIAAT